MNVCCDPVGVVSRLRPGKSVGSITGVGFKNSILDASIICSPYEFRVLHTDNFKREEDVYLTEEPGKLGDLLDTRIGKHALEQGLRLPIAKAPYSASDVKPEDVDNEILKQLTRETLKAAAGYGNGECKSIIVHPLTVGIDVSEEWAVNRSFYLELAALAEELGSDIQILIVNKARDINGHFVRGFCSEPQEAVSFVDELNREMPGRSGKKRFGNCFDIGTATLCGQDIYEAMVPLGQRLKAVIIRDCDGIHDVSLLPYTACAQGQQTDWLNMIRALRKVDFDGDMIVSFEATYSSFNDPLRPAVLKLAYEVGEHLAWHIGMERMVKSHDKRVLFGAGNMCRAYMKDYGEDYPPLFTCDNNSSRWGEEFCGLTIENPEKLKELPEDVVIIMCNMYYDEIEKQIRAMGLKNPIEKFSDEYMATFHMDRLKMAADPNQGKGAKG